MGNLHIDDLVVEYSSGGYAVRPIDGLNLEVTAGSLALLLGPSGCGKTTLLSCLGGILRPTSGRIAIDDVDVTKLGAQELTMYRRRTVGIVFQAFNLLASLTALENVMVPMDAAGIKPRDSRRRAEELLERVGSEGPDAAPSRRPQRRTTTTRRRRPRDRAGSAVDPGRRADRTPGLHPGRGGAPADPRTRFRGASCRRRDARHQDAAAGRPRRGTGAARGVDGRPARDRAA